MTFKEIETKYYANHISLKDFIAFCEELRPVDQKQLSSYDYYYVKSKKEFLRYRAGVRPELTIKKKTVSNNNFVRTEVNLPIDKDTPDNKKHKIVEAFCSGLGFTHNFTIYKTCHIYYYDRFNLVWYVVYDDNMKEKSRFLEIEMDEQYEWPNEASAWSELLKIEKKLEPLGIVESQRVSQSLYEMFRKP